MSGFKGIIYLTNTTTCALGIEDVERTTKALSGIVGKRLTYRDSL